MKEFVNNQIIWCQEGESASQRRLIRLNKKICRTENIDIKLRRKIIVNTLHGIAIEKNKIVIFIQTKPGSLIFL